MRGVHYDSYTEARTHMKDLLDAAERGPQFVVNPLGLRSSMRTGFDDSWLC